jgi:FkbM family methyltransferase
MTTLTTDMSKSPVSPDSFVIYGAGNKGREICAYLRQTGQLPRTFIDTHAQPGQYCMGIPVLSPEKWLTAHSPDTVSVIVAIHNFAVDMPPLLNCIQAMGFAEVINIVEFYHRFPHALPDHYWLTDAGYYAPFANHIASFRSMLADEKSRQLLDTVIDFRKTGNYDKLPTPTFEDQYQPDDLPRWSNPLRFIDCGAFNGDTLAHLQKSNYRFAAIAAFEPDGQNFQALHSHIRSELPDTPATCFPCGVSATSAMLRFSAEQGMGSALDKQGNTSIQCVAIDEVLINFQPNLIKMDIEGAEPEALLLTRHDNA